MIFARSRSHGSSTRSALALNASTASTPDDGAPVAPVLVSVIVTVVAVVTVTVCVASPFPPEHALASGRSASAASARVRAPPASG